MTPAPAQQHEPASPFTSLQSPSPSFSSRAFQDYVDKSNTFSGEQAVIPEDGYDYADEGDVMDDDEDMGGGGPNWQSSRNSHDADSDDMPMGEDEPTFAPVTAQFSFFKMGPYDVPKAVVNDPGKQQHDADPVADSDAVGREPFQKGTVSEPTQSSQYFTTQSSLERREATFKLRLTLEGYAAIMREGSSPEDRVPEDPFPEDIWRDVRRSPSRT